MIGVKPPHYWCLPSAPYVRSLRTFLKKGYPLYWSSSCRSKFYHFTSQMKLILISWKV